MPVVVEDAVTSEGMVTLMRSMAIVMAETISGLITVESAVADFE